MRHEISWTANLARPSIGGRLRSTVVSAWTTWLIERRRRRTVHILRGLCDRTLKDIGVDRSEIESIVRHPGDDPRRHGGSHDIWRI